MYRSNDLRRITGLLAIALFFSMVLNSIALAGFYHDERGLWDTASTMHQCNLLVADLMRVNDTCHPHHRQMHGT
ncbi:MAG: hypothetical protein JO323_05385 [Acidobacteriia bacterium]|nr:hypothetical protein [Terriglobia bacterium]